MNVKRGDICRTPFEPSGLVMVIEVWDHGIYPDNAAAARVVFLEDHPHGYPRGDQGWYKTDELKLTHAKFIETPAPGFSETETTGHLLLE